MCARCSVVFRFDQAVQIRDQLRFAPTTRVSLRRRGIRRGRTAACGARCVDCIALRRIGIDDGRQPRQMHRERGKAVRARTRSRQDDARRPYARVTDQVRAVAV
jgi:hypothetical protein